MSIFRELRRRNVYRVAIAYLIIAWLILQVGDTLAPALHLAEWVNTVLAFFLMLGFPIALIFAWAFELTPEGLKKERNVDRARSITHITGRKFDFAIIGLMAVAILYLVLDNNVLETAPSDTTNEATQEPIAARAETGKSIAVLPFRNRSAVAEDAYFVDGIHDDILTQLAKLSSFGKVISRTSMEQYRETSKPMPQIGQELGVATILEGGVQRAGDRVRINVQLIEAATDEHLWAATYDRSLTASSVFAIQSEIVATIVQQLKASLTPRETQQLTAIPTRVFAAYTAYLQGRNQADIESVESLHAAIDSFKSAVDLDPDFALAYVGLADAYLTLGANFLGGLPTDESNALAEPPLARALELDNSLGEAHATLGLLKQQQGNAQAAEQAYQQAISLRPNYPRVFRLYGRLRWRQGRNEEAMEFLQKALSLDPYSAPANYDVGRLYDESGQFEEALARYLRIVEIEPDHAFAYVYAAAQADARTLLEVYPRFGGALSLLRNADLAAGRYEVARSRYARAFRELTEPEIPDVTADNYIAAVDLALVLMRLGEQDRASDLLEGGMKVIETMPRLGTHGYYITDVEILALQKRPQRAIDALRKAIDEGWRILSWYNLEHNPNLDAIRNEPEFDKLYQVVKVDLANQARRVQELKASGELPARASFGK